ncbi:FUSC family protein [Azospirillum sp. TSO35-2]|uniref:FUSC family protein n=1 Tax=Azospirillum sp. TSO35-2 TaxID=716796 RepID=UPI000D61201B|nr:FUSC family protein [Azospirillum sp. TSO35-2]PWC39765.1 hypothetical protein TSO352_06645 [Azospirillum sp. TSO35-2]
MTAVATLSRLGFDAARLPFALRTALGACLALLVAWLLGLEHPQWSAMTVWASAQPTRGMLVEKSLFRGVGTVVGVVVGVLLVLVSLGQPILMVVGLAVWLGLCAGAGNVLRGFVSYGAILAGYSAAMVALLDTAHPDRILALGLDRFLTVLVGVLTALVIGLLLTPKAAEDEIVGRMRRLTGRVLRDLAARLHGDGGVAAREQHALLSDMAAIEEALDPHGAGSRRSRRSARTLRDVLIAQTAALLWLRGSEAEAIDPAAGAAVGAALRQAADALDRGAAADGVAALRRAVERSADAPALRETLQRIEAALSARLGVGDAEPDRGAMPPATPHLLHAPLHRDWVGAREALIRAAATVLLVGVAWQLSGWSAGAFTLLGTTVMISLFSTFENPAVIMRHVLLGQAAGALAALACRWLVWPAAGGELGLILLVMPFILAGALAVAHRRTMASGFDYNMVMLLLLQPHYPLTGSVAASAATVLAVVAAPVVALAAFRLAYPADARRRMDTLVGMMLHELEGIAAAPDAPAHWRVWRVRLYHRLLRLVRWVDKTGERDLVAIDGSLAMLQVGRAILRLQELRGGADLPPATARRFDAALRRLRRITRDPDRARSALERTARWLARTTPAEARPFADAARAMADQPAIFRRPAA